MIIRPDQHRECHKFSSLRWCLDLQVGGLGDVVTGLARACIERGHAVEVMLPYYESLPDEGIQDLQHSRDLECPKVTTVSNVHVQVWLQAALLRTCSRC